MHTRSNGIYTTSSSAPLPSITPTTNSSTTTRAPLKRQRSEAAPSPATAMTSVCKRARDEFFDALVACNSDAAPDTPLTRAISNPDDLEKAELLRCFDLLHACGRATQPDASLSTTRKSIEGFLEAIFNGWSAGGGASEDLVKPVLDVNVDAEIPAGKVCAHKDKHKDVKACGDSEDCKVNIAAVATYTASPPLLKIELFKRDSLDADPSPICPLSSSDINWIPSHELGKELKTVLQRKIVAKVHKYNKHVAVWQARKMIWSWAKGEDHKEGCDGRWGFVDADQAKVALMGFGNDA